MASDAVRPGFVGALADDGGRVVGFATGWTTPAVLSPDRCYPQVAAGLGTERTRAWLCGGREVDELAVAGAVPGQGIGAALLDAVTADAAEDRCWLITSIRAREALAFYRHLGWVQATHPAPEGDGYAAFLVASGSHRRVPSPRTTGVLTLRSADIRTTRETRRC